MRQQFFEVIEGLVGILQPLIVEHEPFDNVFAQALGGPDAKLGSDR